MLPVLSLCELYQYDPVSEGGGQEGGHQGPGYHAAYALSDYLHHLL